MFVDSTLGIVFAVLAALALAVQALCLRMGSREPTPDDAPKALDALFVVLICNLVAFTPFAFWIYFPDFDITRRSLTALVAAGLCGFFIARLFHYASINVVGASRTEPIKASQPLHATIIAVVLLGETVSAIQLLGIVLITAGVAAVSWETTATNRLGLSRKQLVVGLSLPFLAALFYGIEPTLTRIGLLEGTPVLVAGVVQAGVALGALLAYRGYAGYPVTIDYARSTVSKWYLAAGVANTTFVFVYFQGLALAPVSVVVPIVQSSPVLVIILSFVFIQRLERVTGRLIAYGSVVVVGTILVSVHI